MTETRESWASTADGLLLSLRPWASPDHARIDLPGRSSAYGRDSDSLEAFARSFLLAAIRLRGEYPPINWVWFQIVVETFLKSVGGPWLLADIESGLAVHESLYRDHGWYADGAERAFDHYNGWALHVYPLLWASMDGSLCEPRLEAAWRDRTCLSVCFAEPRPACSGTSSTTASPASAAC